MEEKRKRKFSCLYRKPSEANIAAEFYHRFALSDYSKLFKLMLEVTVGNCRFDAVLFCNVTNRAEYIIEFKRNATGPHKYCKAREKFNNKQKEKYEKFDIPVIYCHGIDAVDNVFESVKLRMSRIVDRHEEFKSTEEFKENIEANKQICIKANKKVKRKPYKKVIHEGIVYVDDIKRYIQSEFLTQKDHKDRLLLIETVRDKEKALEILIAEITHEHNIKSYFDLPKIVRNRYDKLLDRADFKAQKDNFVQDRKKMLQQLNRYVRNRASYFKMLYSEGKNVVQIIKVELKSRFKKEEIEKCLIKHEILTNKA